MKKLAVTIIAIVVLFCGAGFFYASKSYSSSESVRIFVPKDATDSSLRDTLISGLGEYGGRVFSLWKVLGGDVNKSKGSYVIAPGEKAYKIANRIAKGRQTPVKVTVNVARTFDDLTNAIASKIEATPAEISSAMDSVLSREPEFGKKYRYTAAVVPDTYEMYWNTPAGEVVKSLVGWRDKFWTEERMAKAKKIGLTPVEVTTLASIVEEESNKTDEQPVIARLYLNRIKIGMKLQADPTVKFAVGDFSLRRIGAPHLAIDSPYNTYKIKGLPPGPIRVPQKATVDAVLNAPENTYLYMCAKEDFSGYHNFTSDYSTHRQNARRYQEALNKRGIK